MNPSQLAALDILTPAQRELVASLRRELQDEEKTDVFRLDMTDVESAQLVKSCRLQQKEMADEAFESPKNVVILDEKGRVILVYKPNYLPDSVLRSTEAAIETLLENVELKLPRDDDRRSDLDRRCLVDKYGDGKFGVLYCSCWMEQGKVDKGPLVCREMSDGATHFSNCCIFVSDMERTKEKLSLLYAAADPVRWRQCVDIFDALRVLRPSARVLTTSKIDPWTSLALVANVPTDVHRDANDARHMLSGIASSGAFPRSWLVVHSGGFKMRIKPEHGILLNTHVLAHFASSEEGETMELEGDGEDEAMGSELDRTGEAEGSKSNRREWIADEVRRAHGQYILSFFNHQSVQDWVRAKVESSERRQTR